MKWCKIGYNEGESGKADVENFAQNSQWILRLNQGRSQVGEGELTPLEIFSKIFFFQKFSKFLWRLKIEVFSQIKFDNT